MLTLHHLNNSRSQRIVWLLEELNLKYKMKCYKRHPITMLAPQELKLIHPLGKSPVLVDGPKVLAESGAIVQYLLDTYGNGQLIPKHGTEDYRRFQFFLHYAEGSLMPPLLLSLVFSKLSEKPVPLVVRPIGKAIEFGVNQSFIKPQLKLHFDFIENELSKRDWFAGPDFTAADIQMSFPLEAGEDRVGYESRPYLKKYLSKIKSMDSYKRAQARILEEEAL